jgi:hypothetical protein
LQVHVTLPAPTRGFKDVDPSDADVKALLSRIAQEHQAMIEAEEVGQAVAITVKAENRPVAHKVMAVLRDQLLYQPGEESVWRARLLVHPPKGGKGGVTAVLHPKEGTTGRRATAASTNALASVDSVEYNGYKTELVATLNHTAEELRKTPMGMRMAVQFGTVILDEWKKDKAEYIFAELENLVRRTGQRGTAHILTASVFLSWRRVEIH